MFSEGLSYLLKASNCVVAFAGERPRFSLCPGEQFHACTSGLTHSKSNSFQGLVLCSDAQMPGILRRKDLCNCVTKSFPSCVLNLQVVLVLEYAFG